MSSATTPIGKLYGVSIGPGKKEYLTLRAVEVLQQADSIFTVISQNSTSSVSQHVVESLAPRGTMHLLVFSMSKDAATRKAQVQSNADTIIEALKKGKNCAYATLGDAMTYSTFGYILPLVKEALPQVDVEIVPGITSFATLAAKAQCPLAEGHEELRIIPSFDATRAASLEFPPHTTTVLLKTYRSRQALLKRLAEQGQTEIIYGERLTMKDEVLLHDAEAINQRGQEYLSLIIVKS